MIRIRDAQMQVLEADARCRFERDVKSHILTKYPREASLWSHEDWCRNVPIAMEKARSFGLGQRDCVRRFLEYTVLFGMDFETAPEREWMRDILTDESLEATEKIAWIDDGLTSGSGSCP